MQAQNTAPLGVQTSSVVVVDTEELYRATLMGQRAVADFDARARALRAENDSITAALTAEEQALTELRPTLEPEAFRAQAAEFDVRVQGIRRTRDAAIATFEAERDAGPRVFLERVRNILGDLMLERGAVAVLDQRIVFLSLSTVDITKDAIVRIDATFDDGSALEDRSAPND
jgi:Skp family chaperone for outer membrane proteins